MTRKRTATVPNVGQWTYQPPPIGRFAYIWHSCGAATPHSPGPAAPARPTRPDPRVGLKAGLQDAGEAKWNLRLVSHTPKPDKFEATNSDLAFLGNDVIQGNYNGYQIWDISNPARPVLKTGYYCPASQSDVSVYKNLLFVSSESNSGRLDCGGEGVTDSVSHERIRGIRIFDATDITNVKYIGNVQTCRGSHTHTVLVDPKDPDNVYVYISGSAGVRSPSELAFPPLRETKEIQQQLPDGTIVFYYFVTSRNVHAFAIAKDRYAYFTIGQPLK